MSARVQVGADSVSTLIDGATNSKSLLVLGHGAGAGMDSDFMRTMAQALAARGVLVWRFNFLYSELGRRAPDRQPVLESTFSAVLEAASEGFNGRILLGGKSLGARIASHLVAGGREVSGLVFLGYPLHPPGRPERMRDEHLYEIKAPMLFVEGTRDPFCPLPTLERVMARLASPTLVVVEDGDHSLRVRKASGRSTIDAWQEAADEVATWIENLPR
ncbi:MAG: alpha/beta family hydrolase [Actinomycetota bacterium]